MQSFKKFIDSSVWFLFIASFGFSIITIVAQNTVPGDSLYGFKLGYEKVMLASSRFLNNQVDLQIEYVSRRFNESVAVMDSKYASESLARLNNEVESTANTITLIEDPGERQIAAKKYVTQLNQISTGLEYEQTNLISNPTSTSGQTGTTTTIGSNTTVTSSHTTQVVSEINTTQSTIQETIVKMETIIEPNYVAPPPTSTPIPTSTPQPTATTAPAIETNNDPTPTHPSDRSGRSGKSNRDDDNEDRYDD